MNTKKQTKKTLELLKISGRFGGFLNNMLEKWHVIWLFWVSLLFFTNVNNLYAIVDKYYAGDLSGKFKETQVYSLTNTNQIYGFFTSDHRAVSQNTILPTNIQFVNGEINFTDKGGIVIENPIKNSPFYKVEVVLEDVQQRDLISFITALDNLWTYSNSPSAISAGIDTSNSKATYWYETTDMKKAGEIASDQYNFSRQALSKFLRRKKDDIKIEIYLTPNGIYPVIEGANFSSLPNLYTGSYKLNSHTMNYFVLAKWNNGGNPIKYKSFRIVNLDNSLANMDEINAHFIKKTVESDVFTNLISDDSGYNGISGFKNALWSAFLYRAYDYYFKTDYRAKAQELVDIYINNLSGYVNSNINRYGKEAVVYINHSLVNNLQSNPMILYGIQDYLRPDQLESIRVEFAKIIDKSMEYTLKDGCTPINIGQESTVNSCFPANIWYKNDTFAEEITWLLSLYTGYYVAYPNDNPRSEKILDYLAFFGFHHMSSGYGLTEGSSIRQVYGDIGFKYLGDKFLDFKSQYIWNDGKIDNHDFHPSFNYASGIVGTAGLVRNILGKNGVTISTLENNIVKSYEESLKKNYDPYNFRLKNPVPVNISKYLTDIYTYAQDGSILDFYGLSNPSLVEDWGSCWPNYHIFENYGDYPLADLVAKNAYYQFYSGSGKLFCGGYPENTPKVSKCEDSPWLETDLNNLAGSGNEKYRSTNGFVYSKSGQLIFMQNFLSLDGRRSWSRECPMDATGILSCSSAAWNSTDLSNLRKIGNETYRDYNALVYSKNGQLKLLQSFLEVDGKRSWSRECPMDATGILSCSSAIWNSNDLSNLRGVGNEAYRSYDAYIYTDNDGNLKLHQAFLDSTGQKIWYRQCPVNTTGITSCTNSAWTFESVDSIRGIGGEKYQSIKSYLVNEYGEDQTQFYIIGDDGRYSYHRKCHLKGQACSMGSNNFFSFEFGNALYAMLFSPRSEFEPRNNTNFYTIEDFWKIIKNIFINVENCPECDVNGDEKINTIDAVKVLSEINR